MADECDVHLIKEDDLFVLLYLAGVQNPKLAEELHKVQEPTADLLFKTAEAWELAQTSRKGLDQASKASAQAAQTRSITHNSNKKSSGQQPSQNTGSTKSPSASSFQRTHTVQNVANFRCFRCGHNKRDHTCAGIDAICKHCGKKGHFRGVCRARAKAPQTDGADKPKAMATTTAVVKPEVSNAQASVA